MACWGSNYHEMKEGMALILAKHDIIAWIGTIMFTPTIGKGCFMTLMYGG